MPTLLGMVAQQRESFQRVAQVFKTEGHNAGSRLVAEIRGHVARIETMSRVLNTPASPSLEFLWRARLTGAEKAAREVGTSVLNAELRQSNEELNLIRSAAGMAEESPLQVTESARVVNISTGRSRIA